MRQHAEEVQDAIMGMDRPDYSRPRGEPLIFVVEDDELQGEAVSCILQEWGYHVRLFGALSDFGVALKGAAQRGEPPAAVVMDMAFPEGDLAGAETLRELRQVHGEALPPVLFLSMRQDLDARLAAYRSGSVSYLKKPVEARCLLRQLDAITRRLPSEPYRVLMVEDEALILEAQTAVLRGAGMAVTALTEPRRALEQIDAIDPEVIVLDLHMPDISGAELAALLREEARYQEVPIVFLSGEVDEDWQVGALNQGGDEFLSKPVEPDHLSSRVASWARRSRELRHRREQLQAMLREREQEHQALNHHAIVSIADAAGNITYVNDMFCRISGYAREELLGRNHRMLKSGAHPDSLYREMWETIASGRVWHGEICNRRKDGGFYWVESTITPFVDEAGLPYQYVSLRTDITKRMRVEQMAEKARERLRLGQLYANIGTWEWDLVSGDVFWSERIAPLFGYPAGDLETTYDNFLGAVHPDDRQAVVDAVGACIENDTPYEIEHRVVWPDGTVRWLMERGAVQRDAEGNALMMIGVVQDIDVRKRAEMALIEREKQLLEAQSLASIGNWSADLVSGELFWSDEIYRIFGHEPGSVIPSVEAFHNAVHPDDLELVRRSEKRAEQTGYHDVKHRILRPDGSVRHVHELAQMKLDESGKPVHLKGTVQDVTAAAEAQRQIELLSMMIQKTSEPMFLIDVDDDYRLDYVNDAASEHWKASKEELLTWRIPDWDPNFDPDTVTDHFEEMASQPGSLMRTQHRLNNGDVVEVEVLINARTINDKRYIFGSFRNIESRLQAENDLVVAKEESERANQSKSEFLSSMSHELRTPMNAIIGFSQLLEYDEALDEEQQENVQEILKAGNHLLELINEVLDLARVESGRLSLSLEAVALGPVVDECLSLTEALARKHGIELHYDTLEEVWVRADRTRLKQVLLNLLTNAVKYNREQGEVHLRFEVREDRLRLRVADTGHGIPPEKLEGLFEPFNRLGAENGEVEGTGIGLTITRRIMEMMGGSVEVESEVGVGSTFWLELPLESAMEMEDGAAEGDARDTPVSEGAEAEHRVLYIEDNPANLRLVASILGKLPHIHLQTAHLPELGLELARAHKPALILLDINMPGMDGYQVLEALRDDPELSRVPVIAVSANAMPRDIERGMAAGFNDYLTKPIQVRPFIERVEYWLRGDGTTGEDR